MTTRIGSSVVMAMLASATVTFGQVPPANPPALAERFVDPIDGWSLDQAIAHALEREPSLRAARSQIDVARGRREQAGLRSNPSISFERRDEPAGTDRLTAVSVQWPLDLFRRSGRIAVADREIEATTFDVADRERLLAAEVRARYGDVLAAIRDLSLLDELLAATRRQYELLRSRAEEGASPPLERDLLDVEVRRLESDRLLQAGQTEATTFELKRVLGMRADASVRVRETLESVVDREISSTIQSADGSPVVDQRADVRAAAARVDSADARIERARDDGRIDVSAFASYMRMDSAFPQRAFGPEGSLVPIRGQFQYVSIGAMVTIPVLNRHQGEVAAARAERVGAVAAQEAVALAADAEIAAARARDEYARQSVRVYGAGAEPLARRNLGVVTQSYELGRVTVFDVLTEQRRYLDVQRGYTNALRAAYEARTTLNRALGEQR